MNIRYLDIQRMSSEDGPGLRTTVFCKGCSLACKWCHNPESILSKKQVLWNSARCLHCGACLETCPNGAITFEEGAVIVNRRKCEGCFACADRCPGNALEAKGLEAAPEELCKMLLRDRAYFGPDGGVTLSGGEALLQDSVIELMRLLQQEGIQTAADTCGMLFPQQLEAALPHIDVLLYDLKLMDDRLHRSFTGQGNSLILKNLLLAEQWAKAGGRLWIRTPIIPGATDTPENIRAIGDYIGRSGGAERWELCAFNNLCRDKYHRLGQKWAFEESSLMSRAQMDALWEVAKSTCACTDIRWTGAVRQEEEA